MTELSFLIDLLLNHKVPKAVQKLIADRIKEIESKPQIHTQARTVHMGPMDQAPSTLANLNKEAMVSAPALPPSARIVGGEVSTGGGTRGPRKF